MTDASQVAELLKQQVSSPVQFTQSIERMIADGVDTFIEIGPGKTLSSFVRKIDRNVKEMSRRSRWKRQKKSGKQTTFLEQNGC